MDCRSANRQRVLSPIAFVVFHVNAGLYLPDLPLILRTVCKACFWIATLQLGQFKPAIAPLWLNNWKICVCQLTSKKTALMTSSRFVFSAGPFTIPANEGLGFILQSCEYTAFGSLTQSTQYCFHDMVCSTIPTVLSSDSDAT